jgi:hypothetical protein
METLESDVSIGIRDILRFHYAEDDNIGHGLTNPGIGILILNGIIHENDDMTWC